MQDTDIEELQRIWDLRVKGAISEEEYLRLKAQILGGPKQNPDGKPEPNLRTNQPTPIHGPVLDNASQRRPGNQKAVGIGCLILSLLIVVIAIAGSPNGTNQNAATENASASAPTGSDDDANKAANYKAMLKREIVSMRGDRGSSAIEPTKEAIMASALLIGTRAKAYEENAPTTLDAETKTLRAEYKRLAIRQQILAFPKIRAAQAKLLDQLMWEQNIRVAAIGPGNRILRFTGGLFADNAAISAARDNIADTMTLLRFDQDRYEWYRGSEFTYFKRSSLPDAAFANWNDTIWVKIQEPTSSKHDSRCVPALAKKVGLTCD